MIATLKQGTWFLVLTVIGIGIGWGGMTYWRSFGQGVVERQGDYAAVIEAANSPMVLLSSSTCPYCRQAKSFLEANNVRHVVFEVDRSKAAARIQAKLEFQAVPVLLTETRAIIGFNDSAYRGLLESRDR